MSIRPSNIFGSRLSPEERYAIKINRISDRISEAISKRGLSESQIKKIVLENVNKANFNDVKEDLKQRPFRVVKKKLLTTVLKKLNTEDISSRAPHISKGLSKREIASKERILDIPPEAFTAIELFLNPPTGTTSDLSKFLSLLPPENVPPERRIEARNRAREILNYVKSYDLQQMLTTPTKMSHLIESTYALRTLCLQRSQGLIHSFEAYTYSTDSKKFENPFSSSSVEYASNSSHYIPERQRDQLKALQNAYIEMIAMSKRFNNSQRTLYCLGGNTAVGKSYTAKTDPVFKKGMLHGEATGAINPDNVKAALRKEVSSVTNQQIHVEGAAMCRGLAKELKSKAVISAMVFDERFGWPHDLEDMVEIAEKNDGVIYYKDIDGELFVSTLRVLSRDIRIDPCVPFGPIAGGFTTLRKNRQALMKLAITNPRVKQFELYVGDETGKTVLTARKTKDGSLEVMNKDLLLKATSPPSKAEISEVKNLMIDDALLNRASKILGVDLEKIKKYKGMTLEQALLEHSLQLPTK